MSMPIEQVLDQLCKADPDLPVMFDFGRCTQTVYDFGRCIPTIVDSWRGVYAEPALGWALHQYGPNNPCLVHSLVDELIRATDGRKYVGWKGGTYTYERNQILHIDNPGECTNRSLRGIQILDWAVIIRTEETL